MGALGVWMVLGPAALPALAEAPPPAPAKTETSLLDLIPAQTRDRMLAQAPLVDAATRPHRRRAGPPRGYAGIGLVDDHVTLWWKGALPARVAAAVAAARRIAPVEVVGATYTRTELKKAAAKIAPVVDADPKDAAHAVRLAYRRLRIEVAVDPQVGASSRRCRRPGQHPDRRAGADGRAVPLQRFRAVDGGIGIGLTTYACTAGFGVRNFAPTWATCSPRNTAARSVRPGTSAGTRTPRPAR